MIRRRIRLMALGWGALSLILAVAAMASLSALGFPDGHLTAYETETLRLRRLFIGLCLVQAMLIAALALTGRLGSARGLLAAVIASALLVVTPLVAIPSCPDFQSCRGVYEAVTGKPMDHGAGG